MKVSKMLVVAAMMVVGTAAQAYVAPAFNNADPNTNGEIKKVLPCGLTVTEQRDSSRGDIKENVADASDAFSYKSGKTVK